MLQRSVGERALQRVPLGLASAPLPRVATLHRALPSLEKFKKKTAVDYKRRGALAAVDQALDDYNAAAATGYGAAARDELMNAIWTWRINHPDADLQRWVGVAELLDQLSDELQGEADLSQGSDRTLSAAAFNGYQLLLDAWESKIEVVKPRRKGTDYEAIGRLIGFKGQRPIVRLYEEAEQVAPARFPTVTHVNGMAVQPREGVLSAVALLKAVNENAEDKVNLLYTYSATRGLTRDAVSCNTAKAGSKGRVVRSQADIMVAAVTMRRRMVVSAHSRGSIKTDTAVRLAFSMLVKRYSAGSHNATWATKRASNELSEYVYLIYAGNAVAMPCKHLLADLVVGTQDAVSSSFGTSSAKKYGRKFKLTKLERAGHGFDENYADVVGKMVRADIDSHYDGEPELVEGRQRSYAYG
jgi:hypothetical protein